MTTFKKNSDSSSDSINTSRRNLLRAGLGLGTALICQRTFATEKTSLLELPFANGQRNLVAYPQKRPLLVLTSRPVQLETPLHVFNENIFTPNDAFFVRWHLANIPTQIDTTTFELKVRGRVQNELRFSLAELKNSFEQVEIAAVCQCSGNSRGFFNPRVTGGQWGNGAMGNAVWKGVRLRDLLNKAKIENDAVRVRFNGMDNPVTPATPDYLKSIELDIALGEDVLVAYEMNGEPLPLLNGFPLRLVLPGWYATYWVKMLNDIEVINKDDENFWTKTAYRIPDNPCGCVEPGQKVTKSVPINRLTVRSFITNLSQNASVKAETPQEIKGIAFDSGYGIQRVLFSHNGGKQWHIAALGKDYGKYSFREWSINFTPEKGQSYELMSIALNSIGETQRFISHWNPAGYLRNTIETVPVHAV